MSPADIAMQLFTLCITDLTTFESVPHEEWAETEDLFEVGNRFARAMLAVNPSFRRRGMCVAIYDEAGIAVSVMPLGQRFLGSNHIRRRRRVCMTKCG